MSLELLIKLCALNLVSKLIFLRAFAEKKRDRMIFFFLCNSLWVFQFISRAKFQKSLKIKMFFILLMKNSRNYIFHSLSWKLMPELDLKKKKSFLNVAIYFLPWGFWMIIHRGFALWSFKVFRNKNIFNQSAVCLVVAEKNAFIGDMP